MYKGSVKGKNACQCMMRQDVAGEMEVSGNPRWRDAFTSLPSTPPAPVLLLRWAAPCTTCLCALTLCSIQSGSHVKQPRLCRLYAFP